MRGFLKIIEHESFGGILLLVATVLALVFANGAFSDIYNGLLGARFTVGFDDYQLSKPLLLWVNDGLMAIFFFTVGLELKREMVDGELSHPSQVMLPTIAALGGVITPAIIFWIFNHSDSFAIRGWAIPTATDIAFAVGVLMLLGKRVPASLKIFLLTLAIIDDLAAIVIIALFYTGELSVISFGIAAVCVAVLFIMNKMGVSKKPAYFIVSLILWLSVLKSGVHATIAGVVAAFFIPMVDCKGRALLRELEADLSGLVGYFILPVFAFVNAGVALNGVSPKELINGVSAGIFFGLFLGKQIGVFLFSFVMIKAGLAKLPSGANWPQFYGVCILTGIGFTMSLFVDSLAYYEDMGAFFQADKLAILIASLVSGVVGWSFMMMTLKSR